MVMDPPHIGPKMEARPAAGSYVVERPCGLDKEDRVYGSRWIEVESADGQTSFQEVPLTWEDLFDPQVGDHVPHGTIHNKVISEAKESLVPFFALQGAGTTSSSTTTSRRSGGTPRSPPSVPISP